MATDLNRLMEIRVEANKDLLRETKQARKYKPPSEPIRIPGPLALLSLALTLPLVGAQVLYLISQRGRHPL